MRRKLFVFCSVLLCLMLLALPCFAADEGTTPEILVQSSEGKQVAKESDVYLGMALTASVRGYDGDATRLAYTWVQPGGSVLSSSATYTIIDQFADGTKITASVTIPGKSDPLTAHFFFRTEKPVAKVTGVSLEVNGEALRNGEDFVLTPDTQLKAVFTGENLSFLTTDYKYAIGTKEGTLKDSNVTLADDGKRATVAINAADLKDLKELSLSYTNPSVAPVTVKHGILPYEHTITVANHADKVSVDKDKAARGNVVTITVNGGVDYELVELTVTHAGGSTITYKAEDVTDGKVTFAMGEVDVTVSAEFKDAPKFSITLLEMKNGEIKLDAESDSEKYLAPEGKVVKVSPIPNEGYKFDKLIVRDANNHPIEPSADNTFVMPKGNVIVHATFVEAGGVTPVPGTPGTETPDPENPDGENPDGETPDAENPDGETPDGEAPDGETPDGATSVLDLLSDNMMMWVLIGAGVLVLVVVEIVIFTVVGKRRRRRRAAAAVMLKKISVRVESGVLVGREFDCFDSLNIGRDASRCEIVFPMDSNNVGAVNNMLYFKGGKKELCLVDCGTGVTYFEDGTRAEPGNEYTLLPGSKFCVGTRKNQFVVYF